MENIKTKIEQTKEMIKRLYSDMKETLNNALEGYTDFRVYNIRCSCDYISVRLAIYLDKGNKEIAKLNTISFMLEQNRDVPVGNKSFKFTSTIDNTTGEFDLKDKSKGSRTNFYVQVGKVLGNEDIMAIMYNGMRIYGSAIQETKKELENLLNS